MRFLLSVEYTSDDYYEIQDRIRDFKNLLQNKFNVKINLEQEVL